MRHVVRGHRTTPAPSSLGHEFANDDRIVIFRRQSVARMELQLRLRLIGTGFQLTSVKASSCSLVRLGLHDLCRWRRIN